MTIVYAEDNADVRDTFTTLLTLLKARVIGFDNGIDALAYIEVNPGTFDAVLTDNEMPGMDGITLLQKIESVECVKVLLTGSKVDTAFVESLGAKVCIKGADLDDVLGVLGLR